MPEGLGQRGHLIAHARVSVLVERHLGAEREREVDMQTDDGGRWKWKRGKRESFTLKY